MKEYTYYNIYSGVKIRGLNNISQIMVNII